MQVAEFAQRFPANGDGYRRSLPNRCSGRVVCVDCPRDHHAPPLLPLRLPVHIRLHHERFPLHAIRFWCFTHYAFEPEGVDSVTLPVSPVGAEIGVCLRDGQMWIRTATSPGCLICGREPDLTAPLAAPAGAGDVEAPPAWEEPASAEAPLELPGQCPACGAALRVRMTEQEMQILLNGTPASAETEVPESVTGGGTSEEAPSPSLTEPSAGTITSPAEAAPPAEAPTPATIEPAS